MNKLILSKYLVILFHVMFLHNTICIADDIVIFTNKTAYVSGEQIQFDLVRREEVGKLYEGEAYLVTIDLVRPTGEIIETKTLYKSEEEKLFFTLSSDLPTGVYRLIVNANTCKQVVRRINVYGKSMTELVSGKSVPNEIQFSIHGDQFVTGVESTLVLRVMDKDKAGVKMTGTLLNSTDSVITYLKTDANGLVRLNFIPNDSIYTIGFGEVSKKIYTKNDHSFLTKFEQDQDSVKVLISDFVKDMQVAIDGKLLDVSTPTDGVLSLCTNIRTLKEGLHYFQVLKNKQKVQSWVFFTEPGNNTLMLKEQKVKTNSEVKLMFDVNMKYSKSITSIIDKNYPLENSFDFYQSLYFDQYDLNIQWIEDRDFLSYLIYFQDKLDASVNNERLKSQTNRGILRFRKESPSGLLSILPLNTLEPIEIRGEFIEGLHNFQNEMILGSSTVFVYELSNFLRPLRPFDYRDSIDYKYKPVVINLDIDQNSIDLVSDFFSLQLIHDSYIGNVNDIIRLPKADFIYSLNDFDVPDTMEELINQVVKYIVVKRKGREPYLSLYRYMTMYKFEGKPLILIDDLPTFDLDLLLKMDPKDVERVELRNSIASTVTFGNMGMNGAICFYLKSNIENPLQIVVSKMPVLEKSLDYGQKMISSDYAPDFRNQLYWGMDSYEKSTVSDTKTTTSGEGTISTTNTHMILHTKSSNLKCGYQVVSYLINESGAVIKLKSELQIN